MRIHKKTTCLTYQTSVSHSLGEINSSTAYGKSVEVKDYFPDIDKFIASVVMAQRTAGYDKLDKKKRYRLKNHLAKLRKSIGKRKRL